MTSILWGQDDRIYDYGVDRAVLYISGVGVPWNGLTGVEEVVEDASTTSYYFDGQKTLDVVGSENFALHVTAFFSPEEFDDIQGRFNFTYRTLNDFGYKIHLVYNVTSVPSGKTWTTKMDTTDPSDFEWDFATVPTKVPASKPTAHLIVDTMLANEDALASLEEFLYGTDDTDPSFPSAEEVISIFEEHAILVVIDHGDGTWTATGPDDMVHMLDATTFEIVSPTVVYHDAVTYTVSNY